MRLEQSRVTSIISEDGKASLHYEGVDSSHEGGGIYRYEVELPKGKLGKLVGSIIAEGGSGLEIVKKAEEEGLDYWEMPMRDRFDYNRKYKEKHGRYHAIRQFDFPWLSLKGKEIVQVRDSFCELFFHLDASHEFNNSDPKADPGEFYPDRLEFMPYRLDSKYRKMVYARGEHQHG